MRQSMSIISTYTADVSGVCSALYELGGMTIIHDASGCNSTYNTHDEPRWYDMDSMVYISALSEMEAVMGDDEKLISDIVKAAKRLHPKFIALAGTPIPMLMGTDFEAVAKLIEERTGIITFGFDTNGMHSYVSGAGKAFSALAKRMVDISDNTKTCDKITVNLLGVTPLDFSSREEGIKKQQEIPKERSEGANESMLGFLRENGFHVISDWAMGSSLDDIKHSGNANVNLVVSSCATDAAKILKSRFNIPYVIGTPYGDFMKERITNALKESADDKKDRNICKIEDSYKGQSDNDLANKDRESGYETAVIGELITSQSLALSLSKETGKRIKVICPLEETNETGLKAELENMNCIIADPLYKEICPNTAKFIPLPSEAFSGRIFRSQIPNLAKKIPENFFEL